MRRILSRKEFFLKFDAWLRAWNQHDLKGVMDWIHEDIIFENWDGNRIKGKIFLQKAWGIWFLNHGGFRFLKEDLFFDEAEQRILFQWKLIWPSRENAFAGKEEIRGGVDVIHLKEGLIFRKLTYSKTVLRINSRRIFLRAQK